MSIKDKLAAAAGNAKDFVESGKLREGFDKTVAPVREYVQSSRMHDDASRAVKSTKEFIGSHRMAPAF